MDKLLVVGSSINGDGEREETLLRAHTMNDAIDILIGMIKEERERIEEERDSDAHWKRIDCFKFFIGTLCDEMVLPTFDCGTWGEILVEGVDLIVDHEYGLDYEYDFDAIIEELEKRKEA